MSTPDFVRAVVDGISAASGIRDFPDLQTVARYGYEFDVSDAERVSHRAPAVFVAVVGKGPIAHVESDDLIVKPLDMVAVVVTRGNTRWEQAELISDHLEFTLVDSQFNMWGGAAYRAPEQGSIESSQLRRTDLADEEAIALWGVTWRQLARISRDSSLTLNDLLGVDITHHVQGIPGAVKVPGESDAHDLVE